MVFRLVGAENPRLNQPSDVGVIARKPGNGVVSQQVETAVTDMRVVESEIIERDGSASGSHSLKFGMGFGVLANAFVGQAETAEQRISRVDRWIGVVDILDGIDGKATRFLAPLVPPHAVGDQSQSAFLSELVLALRFPVGQRVFVILALTAYVAQAGHFDSGPNLHYASLERKYNWLDAKSFELPTDSLRDRHRTPRLSRTPASE
jgi:hypothetical protein